MQAVRLFAIHFLTLALPGMLALLGCGLFGPLFAWCKLHQAGGWYRSLITEAKCWPDCLLRSLVHVLMIEDSHVHGLCSASQLVFSIPCMALAQLSEPFPYREFPSCIQNIVHHFWPQFRQEATLSTFQPSSEQCPISDSSSLPSIHLNRSVHLPPHPPPCCSEGLPYCLALLYAAASASAPSAAASVSSAGLSTFMPMSSPL